VEVTTREVTGTLIVDCYGQIPQAEEDLKAWRKNIRETVSGESRSIIFHFHDVDRVTQIQLGYWISAFHETNVPWDSVTIVSKSKVLRSIYCVTDSSIRVFETEEEALKSKERSGCFMTVMTLVIIAAAVIWLFVV